MMTLNKNELENIMEKIKRKLYSSVFDDLRKIVLYGSYARGDFIDGSDVDVMVLVNTPNPDSVYAYIKPDVDSLSEEHLVMISCQLQNYMHFYSAINTTSFYKTVEREGVVYYDSQRGY
jgi:predicted nucleotidyltransferase